MKKSQQLQNRGRDYGQVTDEFVYDDLELDESVGYGLANIHNGNNPADIEVAVDGSIRFGAIVVSKSSLTIQGEVTLDDWIAVGQMLRRMHTTIQFLLGDWAIIGANVCGKDFKELIQKIGYTERSLEQFKYVASAVPNSIRIETLKFGHHALVAPMKDRTEQKKWLRKAVDGKWSIAKMRQEIMKASNEVATPLSQSTAVSDNAIKYTTALKALVHKESSKWGRAERQQMIAMLHEILRALSTPPAADNGDSDDPR